MSSSANVPFRKHEVEDYERRRYRGLDQKIVHGREMRILRRFFRRIGPGPERILDVPCGYGRFSGLCLGQGLALSGADLSFHMVRRALDASPEPARHSGAVADLKTGLPFKDGAFEVIFSMRFFHHVHDPDDRRRILAEFGRVSGRWAIVSFYRMNGLHGLQRLIRRRLFGKKTKINMVSWSEFKRDLEAAGFAVRKKKALIAGIHAQHILLLEKVRNGS
ncbi:MAG: class I SAM-dependent methyltransferase [Candidatus Aminicenantes bacterium]|nr:class I SAM-dependent methyltransferase [Candidatus Aminicenantes bacterium]